MTETGIDTGNKSLTYKDTGVDYGSMDPFKITCQKLGRETSKNARRLGFEEIESSRGESCGLVKGPGGVVLGHLEEGLGTKNLVADKIGTPEHTFYGAIAQDTVAMIVNDMATLGVLPVTVCMHLAVGHGDWFTAVPQRGIDLATGWANACNLARCIYFGGETPTLSGIIDAATCSISGSAMGVLHKNPIKLKMVAGNAIIFLESSGIHANGLTLARKISSSATVKNWYYEKLSDGRMYGEALLVPTHIYVPAIDDLLNEGVSINYATNITGHGLRKLMRFPGDFTYRIKKLFPAGSLFDFIQKHGPVSDEEAYGNLNMGQGFALFVDSLNAEEVVNFLNKKDYGFKAMIAGYVEKGERQVIIEPKNLVFKGDTLVVR